MRIDIRYAGIPPGLERRVHVATKAMASVVPGVRAQAWAGSGCSVVILCAEDTLGAHVMNVALRRKVRVIAVSNRQNDDREGIRYVPENVSTSELYRTLLSVFALTQWNDESAGPQQSTGALPAVAESTSIWTRLHTDLGEGDLQAFNGSRTIYLLRSRGRVVASSYSDLIQASSTLSDPVWQLSTVDAVPPGAEVTRSLDVFFLTAATRTDQQMPPVTRPLQLRHWPDLGTGAEFVGPLRVASLLTRRALTAEQVTAETKLSQSLVNACFLAFMACGLVRQPAIAGPGVLRERPNQANSLAPQGFFAKLASHFGLK